MSGENVGVSERVVQRVAAAAGEDVLEMPPLYETVDPDALDSLVDDLRDGEVAFDYAGYRVTVTSDGTITLDECRATASAAEAAETGD